ncbi:MAG: DUF1043 family protein [Gammaproteobacteria bacterium]
MGILIIGCLLGVLFGVLLQRLFGSHPQNAELTEENESLRAEIETLRSQVDGHFATSAVMFKNLTEEYRKLLEHMSDGARALEVELPDQLLADFSGGQSAPQLTEQSEAAESGHGSDAPSVTPRPWESGDAGQVDDNQISQSSEAHAGQDSASEPTDKQPADK